MASFKNLGTPDFLIGVSFSLGRSLYSFRDIRHATSFPHTIKLGKDISWQIRDLETGFYKLPLASSPPKWLEIARREIGVTETGTGNGNPRIIEYNASTSLGPVSEKVPWACSFVSWVFEQAKIEGNLRSASCADWLSFGYPIDSPQLGALVILTPARGTSSHAGFAIAQDETTVTILGGNSADSVRVSRFPKDRVRAYRWPKS
jgi:uncharacterized protein (TIGR02594 family)